LHPDTGLFIYRGELEKEGILLQPKLYIEPGRNYVCAEGYLPTQPKDIVCSLFRLWRKYSSGDIKTFRYYYGLYNMLTVLTIFIATSCYLNTTIGVTAAGIYTVYAASPFADGSQLHAENYANVLIVAALLFSYLGMQHQSLLSIYLAGMLMGFLVISFKIPYLFETLFLGLAFLIVSPNYTPAAAYSLGFISFITLMLAFYLWKGWWPFFWAWFNPGLLLHYRKVPARSFSPKPVSNLPNLLDKKYLVFAAQTGFLWFGLLACLFYNYANLLRFPGIFLLCLLIGSFVNIVVQGKYYLSHFFAALPVITIISAWGLTSVLSQAQINNALIIVVGVILLIISLQQLVGYLFSYNSLEYFLKFYHLLKHDHILAFLAAEIVASYIREHTVAKDKILAIGYNAELFGLARRRAALGRLEFPLCIDPVNNDSYIGPEWKGWLAEEVRKESPKYIADLDGSLDIRALEAASGRAYRLERLFYGIFPVYALDPAATPEVAPEESPRAAAADIINPEAEFKKKRLQLVGRFLEQPFTKEYQGYPETIRNLCRDWCILNKVAMAQ
jgi:hypothetical protein